MLYLADKEGLGGVQGAEIAEQQKIPKKFLDTILLDLKNHGLLLSKRGKKGGYTLARSSASVMVGQIVRILDGPIAPLACISETAYQPCLDCYDEAACQIRKVMGKVRDATADILDNTSLRDMVIPGMRELILHYDI